MTSLLALLSGRRPWRAGRYCGLPDVATESDPTRRHELTVLGGLALVLSRQPEARRGSRFPASLMLYEALERGLRSGHPRVSALLIGEVLIELGDLADAMTRESLRACQQAAPLECFEASSPPSRPATTTRSTRPPPAPEDQETVLSSELLAERSRALRRSVSHARRAPGSPGPRFRATVR